MSNQALCRSLGDLGYEVYAQEYNSFTAELHFENRTVAEENYRAMSLSQLTSLAEQGDLDAQYCLADRCAQNDDMDAAISWFTHAARRGHVCSMEMLGAVLINGSRERWREGVEWLNKAAKMACSGFTAHCFHTYYLRILNEDNATVADHIDALQWEMVYASFQSQHSNEELEALTVMVDILQRLLSNELQWSFEGKNQIGYDTIERFALMAYYIQGVVLAESDPKLNRLMPSEAELLCEIGLCARKLNKPYGEAVLQEAMEKGSDYAAVLMVPKKLSKAVDYISQTPVVGYRVTAGIVSPMGAKGRQASVEADLATYFQRVQRVALNDAEPIYRRAEALYRLSHFYIYGLCCKQDHTTAHTYMDQAAKLGHASAQKLLGHFHKKVLGKWMFE